MFRREATSEVPQPISELLTNQFATLIRRMIQFYPLISHFLYLKSRIADLCKKPIKKGMLSDAGGDIYLCEHKCHDCAESFQVWFLSHALSAL